MGKLSALIMLLWLFPATAAADNLQCIAHPKRQLACPHLLYRAAQLPDMAKPEIVCICVTDFAPLLTPPRNETEQVQANMTRRQYAVIFGAKLQAVLDILQRKN